MSRLCAAPELPKGGLYYIRESEVELDSMLFPVGDQAAPLFPNERKSSGFNTATPSFFLLAHRECPNREFPPDGLGPGLDVRIGESYFLDWPVSDNLCCEFGLSATVLALFGGAGR